MALRAYFDFAPLSMPGINITAQLLVLTGWKPVPLSQKYHFQWDMKPEDKLNELFISTISKISFFGGTGILPVRKKTTFFAKLAATAKRRGVC
ncbi:MAG: hypothetical protein AB1742_03890 [bacterium]